MTRTRPRVTDRQLSRWKNEALEGAFEQQNSKEWPLYVRIASLISDIQNHYKPLLKSSYSEISNT